MSFLRYLARYTAARFIYTESSKRVRASRQTRRGQPAAAAGTPSTAGTIGLLLFAVACFAVAVWVWRNS